MTPEEAGAGGSESGSASLEDCPKGQKGVGTQGGRGWHSKDIPSGEKAITAEADGHAGWGWGACPKADGGAGMQRQDRCGDSREAGPRGH